MIKGKSNNCYTFFFHVWHKVSGSLIIDFQEFYGGFYFAPIFSMDLLNSADSY